MFTLQNFVRCMKKNIPDKTLLASCLFYLSLGASWGNSNADTLPTIFSFLLKLIHNLDLVLGFSNLSSDFLRSIQIWSLHMGKVLISTFLWYKVIAHYDFTRLLHNNKFLPEYSMSMLVSWPNQIARGLQIFSSWL